MTQSAATAVVDRPADPPAEVPVPATRSWSGILVDPRNIGRATVAVLAVFAIAAMLTFVVRDGGDVVFTVLMAWFASIAMEPAVARLSRRMRRGAATGLVMGAFIAFAVLFMIAFGQLLVEQVANLLKDLPSILDGALKAVNERLGTHYDIAGLLSQLHITQDQVNSYAGAVLAGVLGLIGSIVGGLFSMFTFGLVTFYLSADGPRLRRWLAALFPARGQDVFITVWDVTAQKTGGYVGARVILAFINGATSAIVFYIIGMPSWLALGIWTGIVAQFVPTIGTYISIVLPVIVGLLSDRPVIGIIALVWAILYQQVENLTLEPKISAKATDVHPAVAFVTVLLGTALFGVAGAVLAVPVVAMLLSLVGIYVRRHELIPKVSTAPGATEPETLPTEVAGGPGA